jgi:putative endonuclease
VTLKFCEHFENSVAAIDCEKMLKGWGRKKKEALFERNWDEVRKLAKSKNPLI